VEVSAPPSPSVLHPAPPPVPLIRFEDLTLDGEPLRVFGDGLDNGNASDDPANQHPTGSGPAIRSGRAAAGTDLAALDLLCMRVAMGYKVRRLRRDGLLTAQLLQSDGAAGDGPALVVDVHNPEAIRQAEASSSVVRAVMKELESRGIYSLEDQVFAERLYADLQAKGVRCWRAPGDFQSRMERHKHIGHPLKAFDKLLVVFSETSMASQWVEDEIRWARNRELNEHRRILFPIRLVSFYVLLRDWSCFDATGTDLAAEIREYFVPNFSTWADDNDAYQEALEHLLRELRDEGAAPAPEHRRHRRPKA
jgi:hypothetical protein